MARQSKYAHYAVPTDADDEWLEIAMNLEDLATRIRLAVDSDSDAAERLPRLNEWERMIIAAARADLFDAHVLPLKES